MHCLVCSKRFCWVCKGRVVDSQYTGAEPTVENGERTGRRCYCDGASRALFYGVGVGICVIGLPIVGTAVVIGGPIYTVWYFTLPSARRIAIRDETRSILRGSF